MRKKTFIMLLCALMIVSSVAFGTIAYLTDTAGVVNKFTIGNVDITVDETEVNPDGTPKYPEGTELDPDGNPVDPTVKPERTEEENTYPLIPGSEYDKDPTMTVKAGSEEAYVRMVVTITSAAELKEVFAQLQATYPDKYADGFLPEQHVTGWDNTVWQYVDTTEDTTANTMTLEFRYATTVTAADDAPLVLEPLFTTIKVPGEINNEQLETLAGLTIDVQGHAIQTTGFADAEAAWTAFDAQTKAEAAVQTP